MKRRSVARGCRRAQVVRAIGDRWLSAGEVAVICRMSSGNASTTLHNYCKTGILQRKKERQRWMYAMAPVSAERDETAPLMAGSAGLLGRMREANRQLGRENTQLQALVDRLRTEVDQLKAELARCGDGRLVPRLTEVQR